MLCPVCASDLPADAAVCGKCGTFVTVSASPTAIESAALENPTSVQAALASASPAAPAPPYAVFVCQALGFALCLAAVIFNAADNIAHGHWRFSAVAAVSFIVAVVLLVRMPATWQRIEASGADEFGLQGKLLKRSIFFVLVFAATGALIGFLVGQNGKETSQLEADFHEMSSIGDRISKARNTVERTVPAHIEMYKAIESDVDDFDAVLRRLQSELAVYDEKFPDQHEQTNKSVESVKVGIQRATLLKQQITVARDIEALRPDPQWQAWQDRMQPLLDAEHQLDKD